MENLTERFGAKGYITSNTLTLMIRSLFIVAVMTLAALSLSACDRVATVASQVETGESVQERAITLRGRVVGVTDGDTITVLDDDNQQHTIRLAEIDAPERGQPWGNRSREVLSALVFNKTVSVQQTDTDRYDRIVARVFVDGEDVNRAMVEQGAAWAYRQYLTDETLIEIEAEARRSRVGVWSMNEAQTVAPWLWRRGERVGVAGEASSQAQPRTLMAPQSRAPAVSEGQADGAFSCSGKRYCREMSSCAEAHFYLERCGVASLDGNSDGEPCEVLCGTAGR